MALLAFVGIKISFNINFKPSANGCKNPHIPTTLGPLRLCTDAIHFLSAKVNIAIDNNNGIKIEIESKINSHL